LAGLSNLSRSFTRSRWWSQWSPLAFFRSLDRLNHTSKRKPRRDIQGSRALEKRHKEQTNHGRGTTWPPVANFAAEPTSSEKHLSIEHIGRRAFTVAAPKVTSSPALSYVKLPSPLPPVVRHSGAENSQLGDFPIMMGRVDDSYRSTDQLLALQSTSVDPLRWSSTADLARNVLPQRSSLGEPLSPSTWMAGFGSASSSRIGPSMSPPYAPSSNYHDSFSIQPTIRLSEPTSPLSNASFGSDRTPRGRSTSPQRRSLERLSAVVELSKVYSDSVSNVPSGDGSAGDGLLTVEGNTRLPTAQVVRHHPLLDAEVCKFSLLFIFECTKDCPLHRWL